MRKLRIAVTADPELPVPPKFYGGIERVIDLLVEGLIARGHDVTLFAHSESTTSSRLISWHGSSSRSAADTVKNAVLLANSYRKNRYQIVHSFSRIAYMSGILARRVPKIMTYQRAISRQSILLGHRLSSGTLQFTAISDWMMKGVADVGAWSVIPNGVPLPTYKFKPYVREDAPLVFLGRIEEIKGPHLAIEIARRTNRRLIIAGNIPPEKRKWAETNVLSRVDGQSIKYIGPVNDRQKSHLLGNALALLMPILWDEPFGIVMAESMACGTPVLGLRRGAVPEVVQHGITGFVADEISDLVAFVDRINRIDRLACRQRVQALYSGDAIVDGYERLYQQVIGRRETER